MIIKENWLVTVGFETEASFTVQQLEGFVVLIPNSNKIQKARQQIYEAPLAVARVKNVLVW